MKTLRYLVRIDRDRKSDWGASVPDLPGCVATGKTLDSTLRRIRSAIEMHIAGLREDGGAPPRPRSRVVLPGASPNGGVLYTCVDVAA